MSDSQWRKCHNGANVSRQRASHCGALLCAQDERYRMTKMHRMPYILSLEAVSHKRSLLRIKLLWGLFIYIYIYIKIKSLWCLFCGKQPLKIVIKAHNDLLFCGKRPATEGILCSDSQLFA